VNAIAKQVAVTTFLYGRGGRFSNASHRKAPSNLLNRAPSNLRPPLVAALLILELN